MKCGRCNGQGRRYKRERKRWVDYPCETCCGIGSVGTGSMLAQQGRGDVRRQIARMLNGCVRCGRPVDDDCRSGICS